MSVPPEHGCHASSISPTRDDVPSMKKDQQMFLGKESLWAKEMKDFTLGRRYNKVECLLLYWRKEREGDGFLNVEPEIRELGGVFREQYFYGVQIAELNPSGGKGPKKVLNKILSNFVMDHDANDSLLIVYYAGHGDVDEPKDREAVLAFAANSPSGLESERRLNQVSSQIAEHHLKDLDADILYLVDCCFAGMLCGVTDRGPPSKRHFDFLGACAAHQVTRGPGPQSFTRAMIDSLKKLANEEGGFTTSQLMNEIVIYPNFPRKKQTPSSASRTDNWSKMVLAPLKNGSPPTPPADVEILEKQLDFCVTLDFLFEKFPSDEEFRDYFCDTFKTGFTGGRAIYKKIAWRSMHRRSREELIKRQTLATWRERLSFSKTRTMKRKASHDLIADSVLTSGEIKKRKLSYDQETMLVLPLDDTNSSTDEIKV